jgi:co-chaperonin GroES (HSP10)
MKFEPLFAYCALEREKLKSSTIIIPSAAEKKYAKSYGILTEVGPECTDEVKALQGKRVMFKEFAGNWMKLGEDEIFVCHQEEILGAVRD